MELVFWDTEAAYPTPEQVELFRGLEANGEPFDIWETWPFGVGLATLATTLSNEVEAWYEPPPPDGIHGPMNLGLVNVFLDYLAAKAASGARLFGWNTTGYDWRVLAAITGRVEDCTALCLASYDPCFQALCTQGFPVGLNGASIAYGLQKKEMEGASAPLLWPTDEWEKVVKYGKGDAERLKQVVINIMKGGGLRWVTTRGGLMYLPMPKFLTVEQCLELPYRPPRWITKPIIPVEAVKWFAEV